jgi:glycosyltransferase involved in cell wall biosynthesis
MNARTPQIVEIDFEDVQAGLAPHSVAFLVSGSRHPCGVEMFERELARAAQALGTPVSNLVIGGHWRDARTLWHALAGVRALVVSLPVVAWKKTIFTPLLALVIARLRGARTVVILHEWGDLNPMRRACFSVYLLFAKSVMTSSPNVRRDFQASALGRLCVDQGLVPIPPNIGPPQERVSTQAIRRLRKERALGRFVLGQFGSIYPKKQASFLLEVARDARNRGLDVFVVFIGGFVKGRDDGEAQFLARVKELGLEDFVLVTGYIETDAEIHSLFDAVDIFVYAFAEGLTSRRGSVLACLQSGRPVLANAPIDADEFAHHPVFQDLIDRGALHFVPSNASASDFAEAVAKIGYRPPLTAPEIFATAWRDAAIALRKALR